jgi:hypothetical protein
MKNITLAALTLLSMISAHSCYAMNKDNELPEERRPSLSKLNPALFTLSLETPKYKIRPFQKGDLTSDNIFLFFYYDKHTTCHATSEFVMGQLTHFKFPYLGIFQNEINECIGTVSLHLRSDHSIRQNIRLDYKEPLRDQTDKNEIASAIDEYLNNMLNPHK